MGRKQHRMRRPPQHTADLLGLLTPERLPAASRVIISSHAVERFHERCAPELSIEEARRELRRLVSGARVRRERPLWAGPPSEQDTEAVGYIVVRDGSCPMILPIGAEHGRCIAVTCIVGA